MVSLRWIRLLTVAGWIAGAAVILYGLAVFLSAGILPALLVALAVVIAGPLEDVLKGWVRRRKQLEPEEPLVRNVDLTTSLVFLALLLWGLFLIRQST